MSASSELALALLMVLGLVGVVVPALPGLLLIWGAGVAWVWLDGAGTARIVVGGALTLLLVVGTAAKYVLPARTASGSGAPRGVLALGTIGAIVGFFVIPVVGFVIGGVGVVFVAEWVRVHDVRRALRATLAVLRAVGIGMLVELTTAVLMIAVWAAGVQLT